MENLSDQNWRQDLLRRYLANQCTPEERAHVEKWYESLGSDSPLLTGHEHDSLKRIRKNLLATLDKPSRRRGVIHTLHPFLRVAAVLVFVIGAGMLAYRFYFLSEIYDREFATRKGEQKTIVLPDSSVVTLNADSRVHIYYNVRKHQRQVTLLGEACFVVTKNPGSPFKVSTNRLTTQVLGTIFNVQAYKSDDSVVVTVAEGKVAVAERNGKDDFVKLTGGLLPDQQLVYNVQKRTAYLKTVDSRRTLGWRDGSVFFDNASLAEIATRLERRYGLDISVVGAVNSECRYTFGLRDEPLSKALEILEKVSGTQIVKNKSDQLTFNISRCK